MADERGFSAKVTDASKELSHKEKIALADTTNTESMEKATENGEELLIDVDFWAEISIHNEHSEDKDYKNYIVVDKDGTRYRTGSKSFWTSFRDIFDEMSGDPEPWKLKVYQRESKNRAGKTFITCSII